MASLPIQRSDLLGLKEYDAQRSERVGRIIALKKRRRIEIGPWISLVFENRATVLHQIQEMLRIERIVEPSMIDHEIETYADLLPGEGELSATLFIEITDDELRREAMRSLGGIEKTLALELGGKSVAAFDKRPIDPRWERPGQATAVYYMGFKLGASQRIDFAKREADVWLKLSHPRYRHAAALSADQRKELSSDWG